VKPKHTSTSFHLTSPFIIPFTSVFFTNHRDDKIASFFLKRKWILSFGLAFEKDTQMRPVRGAEQRGYLDNFLNTDLSLDREHDTIKVLSIRYQGSTSNRNVLSLPAAP
jgi:hypothetical protein